MALITPPTIDALYLPDYSFVGGKRVDVELQSGGTYSATLSVVSRYRMTIRYNCLRTDVMAPAPYGTLSEAQAVRDFIAALGRGDTTQIADPTDGVLRTWTLDGSFVPFSQAADEPFFKADLPLRSV